MCVVISENDWMYRNSKNVDYRELYQFSRYLILNTGEDGTYGVKGIRSDAPDDVIDRFISWYRENNRYENGRLRPEDTVRRRLVISV